MASSLTRSTNFVRKAVIGFVIFAILVIVLQGIYTFLTREDDIPEPITINRTGYVAADNEFGQLPKPELSSLTLASGTRASFSIAGNLRLPEFPPVVNIYRIEPLREKLGDADRARRTAELLGFSRQESRLENNILIWENTSLSRTLTYDKVNHKWDFNVNLQKDSIASLSKIIKPDPGYYESFGSSLLSNVSISTNNYIGGNNRVDYVALNTATGEIINAIDKADADYVRITLFKQLESATLKENYNPRADEVPSKTQLSDVLTRDYLNGSAEFIIQGDATAPEEDYISFEIMDYSFDEDFAVYDAITAEAAWDLVQANQGYLIWLKPEEEDPFAPYQQQSVKEFQANANATEIVYIEPKTRSAENESTHYLYPYYRFTGFAFLDSGERADFAFVVPAINSSHFLAN